MKKTYYLKLNPIYIYFSFAIIVFFIGFLNPLNPINGTGLSGTDSSVYRYIGKVMTEGATVYKDVFDHKGPIMYFLNAIGYKINPIWGIWTINTLMSFLFSVYIYKISKLYSDSILVTYLGALVSLLQYTRCYNGGNTVEGYCVVFITIQLYVFLKFLKNNNLEKYNIYLCGISAALVCMLKINTIVVCVVYIPYISYLLIKNRQYKRLLSIATGFIIGFIAVIVSIVLYLIYKGAFSHFIEYYFIYNFKYIGSTMTDRVIALFYFLKNFIVLIPLIFLVYRVIKYRKGIDVAALMFIILSLLTIASPGRKYGYYAIILSPTVVYPYVLLIQEIFSRFRYKAIRNILIGIIAVGTVFFLVYRPIKLSFVTPAWTSAYIKVSKIVQENTLPTDKISVIGNANLIYLLSERNSATKYDFVSGSIYSKAISEIKQVEPKVIVVMSDSAEDMNDFLNNKNYTNVYETDAIFTVWVRDSN